MLISARRHRPFALALLGVSLTSLAGAQDLAAMARKEKERRAKVTKPVKVLTEEDGKKASADGVGSVTSLEGGSITPAPGGATTTTAPDAQRSAWKARMDAANRGVVTAEATLAQMERDLAALRSDMSPVTAADAMDPMRLQKRDQLIYKLNNEITAQRTAVAEAKKAVTAVEDEARRSGVPAGWLR